MKILYAAGNRNGAADQLNRFLKIELPHAVKIAAYTSCIKPVDWNLTALLNIFDPGKIHFSNDNLEIYYDQIKSFSPDLVISDLEPFTSYLADTLNIPILQVSPRLFYDGLINKYSINVRTKYLSLLGESALHKIKKMSDKADCNFAYSHLCDLEDPPELKSSFEFIRPYHILGKKSFPCQHNLAAISTKNDRELIRFLKNYNDVILFTGFRDEEFPGIILKDITNINEYACNLYNCNYFINRGNEEQLADAFYNSKFSWIIPDFTDQESIINAMLAEYFGTGQMIYDQSHKPVPKLVKPHYNAGVKFLHERLNDF